MGFPRFSHEQLNMFLLVFTHSSLSLLQFGSRRSMTDVRGAIDPEILKRNVGILVEALASDVYGLPKQSATVNRNFRLFGSGMVG